MTPPIGIPEPVWGALNPCDAVRPSPPSPWNSNQAGYYYIEQGGTNVGNGYPGNPKGSFPSLSAGDKVYIAGNITSTVTLAASGTEGSPVWVTSYDTGAKGTFKAKVTIDGASSYLLIDQVLTDFIGSGNGKFEIGSGADHIAFRDINLKGCAPINGSSTSSDAGENQEGIAINGSSGNRTNNIVVYNCTIHDTGNVNYASGDPDAHCVSSTAYVDDVWILDTAFSHTSGNAVQIGAGTTGDTTDSDATQNAYIGRCTATNTAQAGFWSKRATNVIFSQNTCHGTRRDTPSSPDGSGIGSQYGTRNLWIIFNTIYDCQCGVQINGASLAVNPSMTDTDKYVVGNLIYNIRDVEGTASAGWRTNQQAQGGVAISCWAANGVHIVNNTIHDYDAGVVMQNDFDVNCHGNIFSGRNNAVNGGQIICNTDSSSTADYNLIDSGDDVYVKYGATVYTSFATFNAARGTHNINAAPTYTNEAGDDYSLTAESAGVDAFTSSAHAVYGTFSTAYSRSIEFDIEGTARPQNTDWDVGAFEVSGTPPPEGPTLTTTTLNVTTLVVG